MAQTPGQFTVGVVIYNRFSITSLRRELPTDPTLPTSAENQTLRAPLPQDALNQLYSIMLKARMLAQRFRKAPHTAEALLAGTLQNVEDNDVIVSAAPNPVLEFLRAGIPASDGIANTKPLAATPRIFPSFAVGLASAGRIHNSVSVVIGFASGKATHGPAFDQAAVFAAQNRLPLVIVADWSASRHSSRSHDGRSLSRWPFPTIAVDARDAIAVYRVTKEAIGAARRGHGPTLVDGVNFLAPGARGSDHRDPLLTFRGYLQRHGAWSDEWHAELRAKFKLEIAAMKGRKR